MDLSEFESTYHWCEHHGLDWREQPQDGRAAEWARLKALLWQRHYDSLSPDLRTFFEEGRHSSLSWGSAAGAEQYAGRLEKHLEGVPYVRGVDVGYYEGDTLVLNVKVNRDVSWRTFGKKIPELFEGFQVFVVPVDAR